ERRQQKEQGRMEALRPLQERLMADDLPTQLEAAHELRTMLDGPHPPALSDVLHADLDIAPRLLQLSQQADNHDLHVELLLALKLLTSGAAEQTRSLVDLGAVDIFERLLASPDAGVRELAVTILGNIAGASVELRNNVIGSGVANDVMKMLAPVQKTDAIKYYDEAAKEWKFRGGTPEQPTALVRKSAQCLRQLCQGQPAPDFGAAHEQLVHTLSTLVMSSDDEVVLHACAAMSQLQYAVPGHLAVLVKDGVCVRLLELLGHSSSVCSEEVRSHAALTLERIAGSGSQGQEVIIQSCEKVLKEGDGKDGKATLKRFVEMVNHAGVRDKVKAMLLCSVIRF
ncbi:unnamed protein product, partial [Polarella glacialis]